MSDMICRGDCPASGPFDSELRDHRATPEIVTGVPAASAFLLLVPICVDLEFGIGWARERNMSASGLSPSERWRYRRYPHLPAARKAAGWNSTAGFGRRIFVNCRCFCPAVVDLCVLAGVWSACRYQYYALSHKAGF